MQYAVVETQLKIVGQTLDDLDLISFTGHEEISVPSEYVVRFMTSTDTTTKNLAGSQVSFSYSVAGLLQRNTPAHVHGYVKTHRVLGLSLSRTFITEITIAPRLSKLALGGQRQVFGTTSPIKVADLVKSALDPVSYKANTSTASDYSNALSIDYSMSSEIKSSQRDFVLQYDEDDLSFLRRLCEQEGIFFFFKNDSSKETVTFGDTNQVFDQIDEKISFVPEHLANAPQSEHVRTVRMRSDLVPKKAYVRDFDDDKASQQSDFLRNADSDSNGYGASVTYCDQFTELSDGDRYAKIRAEEQLTWKTVYAMETNSTRLRPGVLFTLDTDEKKLSGFNIRFLVVASEVNFSRGLDNVWVENEAPFTNRIDCVALATNAPTFRPRRRIAKPKVAGILRALIDTDTAAVAAGIGSDGTYKIRLIEEESNQTRLPNGKASAPVSQAQPFGGSAGVGMQFPLYRGTEVALAFIGGDPDRPVIVGTVNNSTNTSVLNGLSSLNTTNRVNTPSGIVVEMIDG